jgi:hypothetical protein
MAQDLARKAIAGAAMSFSYGALRAGWLEDVETCADQLAPRLHAWGLDAALTIETLAAEALYGLRQFDSALRRFPERPPRDVAGKKRPSKLLS